MIIALDQAIKKEGLAATMLLQIHDEILVETPLENADPVDTLIKKTLEGAVDWNVPLIATTHRGSDWQAVSK